MLLSCKRSAGKSLVGHILRDGSRLKEGVQSAIRGRAWVINPGGLYYLLDSPQAGLQVVVQIHVRVGILGPHVGFDLFGPS